MDRLIDERLAERGLAPLPSTSGSSSSPPASSAAPAASAKNTGDDPAAASLKFLARFDELMKDYTPQLPLSRAVLERGPAFAARKAGSALDHQVVAGLAWLGRPDDAGLAAGWGTGSASVSPVGPCYAAKTLRILAERAGSP